MKSQRSMLAKGISTAALCILLLLVGCDENGSRIDSAQTVTQRNLSAIPGPPTQECCTRVSLVPRDQFGVVPNGNFVDASGKVTAIAANALFFPEINASELAAVAEGLQFFHTPLTAAQGLGPASNATMCLGCHRSSSELPPETGLVTTSTAVSRAARATPTNFEVVAGDFVQGGVAPDSPDAINGPGRTEAFLLVGDFDPITGAFQPVPFSSGELLHLRPPPDLPACVPEPITPPSLDPLLQGDCTDPQFCVRRTVGERSGPPYIGLGLREAIHEQDLAALEDPLDSRGHASSLDDPTLNVCANDCISGRRNFNTLRIPVGGDPFIRTSRFGVRAQTQTIFQVTAGAGGRAELGLTSIFFPDELISVQNIANPACVDKVPDPDVREDVLFSMTDMLRMIAPPQLGRELLALLNSADPTDPRNRTALELQVQRGAQLFGVDLVAFANRIAKPSLRPGADGRNDNAINVADGRLFCAGCHPPVVRTGTSPAEVGPRHLSDKWIPLFSDLLIHNMGEVTPERVAPLQRRPFLIARRDANGVVFNTFDISRNIASDTIGAGGAGGLAAAREFRTQPLWATGRIGPPFFHDSRVYLSTLTVNTTPAGTVRSTNALGEDPNDPIIRNGPLVIRTLDDAIRAAIELHDLPWPESGANPAPPGSCPLPPGSRAGVVVYRNGAADVCPPFGHPNRSEAQKVIQRYWRLNAADQQALIEFLKQL